VAVFHWLIPIRYRIEPGPLDHLKTNDSDQIWGAPHLGFQRGHRKWCGRRRCAPVVIDGGSAGAPGTREDVDGVRLITVSPIVWTTWPIVSRRAGGERPEEARCDGDLRFFVCGESLRAKPFSRRSEDAHEREEEVGTTNGWRRPRLSPESSGYACSHVGLRR
jgi:hypothetical protein